MANVAWQNLAFSPIEFDPSAGFASAGDTFKGVNETLDERKRAEARANAANSLAAYRQGNLDIAQQDMAFKQAAPQRAEDLREANLARSASQGLFADQVASGAGGSHMQEVLAAAQDNPAYMAMSGPERADFAHQALQKNKRLFSDPTAYHKEVRTKLLESGDFSREDADTISAQKTAEQFPTMDKDLAVKLFKTDSKGSGSAGKAGKQLFTQESPRDRKDQRDNFFDLNEITDKTAGTFRIDPGDYNPTQQNVGTFLSDMGSGQDGVTQDNALAYLQTLMGNSGNVTSGHDISNLSPDDLAAFKTGARNMRAAKERTTGGTAAGSVAAQNASNQLFNQGIMDRMNPDQSSREKRLSTFFSGLPGGAKPNLLQDTIDTGGGTPAPAPALGLPGDTTQTDPILANIGANAVTPENLAGSSITFQPPAERQTGLSKLFDTTVSEFKEGRKADKAAAKQAKTDLYDSSLATVTQKLNTEGAAGVSKAQIFHALRSENLTKADEKVLRQILKSK